MSEQQTDVALIQKPKKHYSKLLDSNPLLNSANGVYQNTRDQIRESGLPNYIQVAANDLLDEAEDLSLYSIDIEKRLLTDELREAFSPAPENFLLSFNLDQVKHVLDLTQGFGGTTHFLAKQVSHVDCVRIDITHARLSAKRCAAFNNISYVSEDISELRFPDNYYDLIIISELDALELDKRGQIELLKRLNSSLRNAGSIAISVENRGRLSKLLSEGPDIISYKSLYQDESVNGYNETELTELIVNAGFKHYDAYASFSAPRAVQNIFSKQYLDNNTYSINHFSRLGGIDNSNLNEYLLFKNLAREHQGFFNLASRFVMIAGASSEATTSLCNNDFAHYSGVSRKPQWRATTQCQSGSNIVSKTLVHPHYKTDTDELEINIKLDQTIEPQPFQNGSLLIDNWLSALLEPTPLKALNQQILEYKNWIFEFEKQDDFCARAYDALPFNIIVDDQGEYSLIDPEWVIDTEFGADFVLFRALFWFAFENKSLIKELAKQSGVSSIGLFVAKFMDNISEISELSEYVHREEIIQSQISLNFRSKSVEYALSQTFDGEPIHQHQHPACQISWSDSAGVVDERTSVFVLWKASTKEQTLSIEAPTITSGKSILRVDPIASMGIFKFTSIALISGDGERVWALSSATEISEFSTALNVSPVSREIANGQCDISHFIALNEDPHFLFDLTSIKNRESACKIEIRFALVHNQHYQSALATLSQALAKQNVILTQQVGVVDTKQAEIEYLSTKLARIDEHRQNLQASIHTANLAHEQRATELSANLSEQIERYNQLERNLAVRVALKFTGVLSSMRRFFSVNK